MAPDGCDSLGLGGGGAGGVAIGASVTGVWDGTSGVDGASMVGTGTWCGYCSWVLRGCHLVLPYVPFGVVTIYEW